ncbi:MAG TPA: flagellar biosynthesis protein FliQ [Chitinispirillaceae bacterium]|jgi:flagellar biosynthetic protein FliQ|nr:flagellar biosynthesis protein FliQ [Chitinispirillaceae bacterium]
MDASMVIDLGRQALIVVMTISGPMLIAGLLVGLIVGVFQAVTQIHEMTLTFIPKIVVMVTVFLAFLPWMLLKLVEYTASLFELIGNVAR